MKSLHKDNKRFNGSLSNPRTKKNTRKPLCQDETLEGRIPKIGRNTKEAEILKWGPKSLFSAPSLSWIDE